MSISIGNNLNFDILLSQKVTTACHVVTFFVICSNPVNPIQAVFIFCVDQLISCQKCLAMACAEQSQFEQFTPTPLIVSINWWIEMFYFYSRYCYKNFLGCKSAQQNNDYSISDTFDADYLSKLTYKKILYLSNYHFVPSDHTLWVTVHWSPGPLDKIVSYPQNLGNVNIFPHFLSNFLQKSTKIVLNHS